MRERHYRSVLKGATWRIVATSDTVLLAWFFTGHISWALKIGAVEVCTKILLFYLHDRLWMRVKWWRTQEVLADGTTVTRDNHYRSVIKGASYRFFGSIDTFVIALFITHNYTQSLSIGFTEVFTKIGLFYLHERLWAKIPLGIVKGAPLAVLADTPPKPLTEPPVRPLTERPETAYAAPSGTNTLR